MESGIVYQLVVIYRRFFGWKSSENERFDKKPIIQRDRYGGECSWFCVKLAIMDVKYSMMLR